MAVHSNNLRPVQKKNYAHPAKRSTQKKSWLEKMPFRDVLVLDKDYYDYNLLAVVILLTCFGLVMLYSTSAYEAMIENGGDDMTYFRKQAFISIFALLLALGASLIDYHFLASLSLPLYGVAAGLLIITKFIGREVNGAKRWIYFGPISFQPAELAKLAIILFLPMLIVKMGHKFRGLKPPCVVLGFGGFISVCTFYFTDNLSTAVIILGITVLLIFIAHPKTKVFVLIGLSGIALIVLLVFVLTHISSSTGNFRIRRIQVWLDPESNASLGGYQIMQGLYAIGSGGFFGKGLGNSTQKLGALPEAQNDMIFSIICEELGVFGAVLVIMMFIYLLYRLFFIAQHAPDLLGALIVSGIFVHIALQVVLNIAVVTNLIPTTGITLPFVSYGGTSILFLMSEMALALGVSRQIRFNP